MPSSFVLIVLLSCPIVRRSCPDCPSLVVLVVRPTCPTSVTLPPNIQRLIAVLTCGEAEGNAKLSPPPRSQVEHLVPAHIVRRNKVLDEVSTAIPRDRVARNAEVTCERERDRLTDWLALSIVWKHPPRRTSPPRRQIQLSLS